jgi:endogenous inhibitor of DNA gyrase (YacG/DUF329 family)
LTGRPQSDRVGEIAGRNAGLLTENLMYCPHCGKEVGDHQPFCQFCGTRINSIDPSGGIPGRERTSWEDRQQQGLLKGLLRTLRTSLFNPSQFFRSMNVSGGLTEPMLYALIVGMAGIMVFYFWQILLQGLLPVSLTSEMSGPVGLNLFSGVGMAVVAFVMPFIIILHTFLWAGLLHVVLMMVQGAKNGFEATFRTVAYSYGSNVFLMIPFCGGLIAGVWNIIIVIIGLKESHGTSGGKAAFAVLFPVIFCCAAVLFFVLAVLGIVAASFGTFSHQPWKL